MTENSHSSHEAHRQNIETVRRQNDLRSRQAPQRQQGISPRPPATRRFTRKFPR